MTTINDKFSQPVGFDKVGGYQFVEGAKFEMPEKQAGGNEQSPIASTDKEIFEEGMKRLGLYDLVRRLNYPVV